MLFYSKAFWQELIIFTKVGRKFEFTKDKNLVALIYIEILLCRVL